MLPTAGRRPAQKINWRLTTPNDGRFERRLIAGISRKQEQKLIRFENVGLRYGMGPEILRDISFHIPERSFQFLSGPSGAGKTTLLRLLFLSLKPTRGLITIFGKDRSRITRQELPLLRRRIGVGFQDIRCVKHIPPCDTVA